MLRSTWLRHISSPSLRQEWVREICRRKYSLQTDQDFSSSSRSRHSSIKWKHLHPEGRVVGSGRKRQRVISADLVSKSLDQPARVVLLQDFQDDRRGVTEGASLSANNVQQPQQTLSAQDIERVISSRHMTPDDAEISASIQTLRPDSTVLDQGPFERLRQQLTSAYSLAQLSSYLAAVLSPSSAHGLAGLKHTKVLKASTWQPGRTALDTRPARLVKSTTLSRKARTADRILRLAWRINVYSEEREMGELELNLQPWQMSMLFDLTSEGEVYYKRLLSPPSLAEATEVLAWRPNNIVRIVGRRRDAEEVAYQLEVALSSVHRSEMDLADFTTGMITATQVKDICTKGELDHISKLTLSVIVANERSTVAIYNRTAAGSNRARRLLLSLLSPPPLSVSNVATLRKRVLGESVHHSLPADAIDLGLHIAERRHDSTRQVTKSAEQPASPATSSQQRTGTVSSIVDHLQSLNVAYEHDCTITSGGYWNGTIATSEWQAEVVRLLQSEPSAQSPQRPSELPGRSLRPTAVQRHFPGVETALSCLDLHKNSREGLGGHLVKELSAAEIRGPRLIAYLAPSPPFGDHRHPPPIEMHFSFVALPEPQLRLIEMTAILNEQAVEVPLPSNSVDLLFTRQQAIGVQVELANTEVNVAAFTKELQESVRTTGSTISAPPEVVIQLPASLMGTQHGKSDLPTTYLLERLEQTQARTFAFKDTGRVGRPSGLAHDTVHNLRLEYKEIESDSIRGSSSVLAVKYAERIPREAKNASAEAVSGSAEGASEGHASRVFQTALAALHVADILTDATDGSLKPWKSTQ